MKTFILIIALLTFSVLAGVQENVNTDFSGTNFQESHLLGFGQGNNFKDSSDNCSACPPSAINGAREGKGATDTALGLNLENSNPEVNKK